MMDRTATDTIMGFNYQFNKSILEILNADLNTQIRLEGYIEDLDLFKGDDIIGIQCKYYESVSNLTPSTLAKPIFDMLISHIKDNNIKFKLYIHCKNDSNVNTGKLSYDIFKEILNTRNKKNIKKYFPSIYKFDDEMEKLISKPKLTDDDVENIHKCIDRKGQSILKINIENFIDKVEVIPSESNSELVDKIIEKIMNEGHSEEEAINILYPNFFQKVAMISSIDDVNKRLINCNEFKNEVYSSKKLLYSKWLLKIYSIESYKRIIKNSLKIRLQNNSSVRVIYIDVKKYSSHEIAAFIVDYIKKYNSKSKLNKCPFFIIEDDNYEKCSEIQTILYDNYKLFAENGDIARKFNLNKFIEGKECKLKLCLRCKEVDDYLQRNLPNDLFAIGDVDIEEFENKGIYCCKIEKLDIASLKEIFYLGGKK